MKKIMLFAIPFVMLTLLGSSIALAQVLQSSTTTFNCDLNALTNRITCGFPREMERNITQIHKATAGKISLDTSGTEYLPNDNATVYARMLDANSRPINIGSCNTTVYMPNKTVLLDNVALTLLEKGIYFKDFQLPSDTGVYITVFDCQFPGSIFNVNKTLEITLTTANPSFFEDFAFDNSNNLTINSGNLTFVYDQSPTGQFRSIFSNNLVFSSVAGADGSTTVNLTQSNFTISENQEFSLELISATGTAEIHSIKLFVNYTSNEPQQLIRGQDEIHVRTDLQQIPIQNAIVFNSFEQLANHNLCLNEITLQHNISLKVGTNPTQQIIQTEDCPFGCDTENNKCNPSPLDVLLWYIVGGIVGVIVLILIILRLAR